MKRLLVTSDDFGMCHAINVGTLRAMTAGIVRSTNLMAPCPWFEEAARLCVEHALPTGVHLTLTCEWDQMRWRPLSGGPGLSDARGFLPCSHEALAGRATEEEIRHEFVAQIECVRSCGIAPTHLDTHMLPSHADSAHALLVQAVAARLAAEYRIPFTYARTPRGLVHFADELEISSFSDEHVARTLASWHEPGTYYLSGHAAVPSEELRALSSNGPELTPWSESYRTRDLEFFTAPATRQAIEDQGFTLIGIAEL